MKKKFDKVWGLQILMLLLAGGVSIVVGDAMNDRAIKKAVKKEYDLRNKTEEA